MKKVKKVSHLILTFLNLKKIEKILDTTGIFVIIIPMFFNVKEVDIYEDDIPT